MSRHPPNRLALIGLPIALLLWLAMASFLGEKVQQSDGLGWDGLDYATMARQGPVEATGKYDRYRAQRLAMPTAVHLGAALVRWPLTTPSKQLVAFEVYQLFVVAGGIAIWWRLCRHLRLGPQASVLCFAGLFLNFATLKLVPYMPTIGDVTGLVLGLLMVHLHLTERPGWLALTAAVGAFTFPTLLPSGALLLVLPARSASPPPAPTTREAWPAFAIGALVAATALTVQAADRLAARTDIVHVRPELALPFALLVGVYLSLALRLLLSGQLVSTSARAVLLRRVPLVLLIVVATSALAFAVSSPTIPLKLSTAGYVDGLLYTALVAPFGGLVCHVVNFGPLVIVACARWREVCGELRARPGLHVVAVSFLVFSVGTESRQLTTSWPVFVVALCVVLDRRPLSWSTTGALVLVSIAASRLWLPLNHGPLTDVPTAYPDQWYFMTQGPWMTTTSFAVNVVACVVVAGLVAATGILRTAPAPEPVLDAPCDA